MHIRQGRVGRGYVGNCKGPTFHPYSCLCSPHSSNGSCSLQVAATAETCCPIPLLLGAGQLTAALLFFLQEEIRNRSLQATQALSSLSVKSVASPTRLGFQVGMRGCGRGGARAQPAAHRAPSLTIRASLMQGTCSAAFSLLPPAQLLLLRRGSALCPSKFEILWTEGGSIPNFLPDPGADARRECSPYPC